MKRVAIIGSAEKASVRGTLERLRRWLEPRAQIVGCHVGDAGEAELPRDVDLVFVLGGDGTLISVVHRLGSRQVPIVGVNLGKLGYLAEFTIAEIEQQGEFLFREPLDVTRRLMLEVTLRRDGLDRFGRLAVNDCVVLAGPPFRMIELTVAVDDEQVALVRGDGLIVATPSGSTAHNLSAGGPILEPAAQTLILTPICPHALTFRPLALDGGRRIEVSVREANEGTTVVVDGQFRERFRPGDVLAIRRCPSDCLLVRNPRRSAWYALRRKLMWGENPKNGQ